MNKKYVVIALLSALVSPIDAKEQTMVVDEKYVQEQTAQGLKLNLEQLKKQGYTISIPDKAKSLLQEKVKGVVADPATWVTQIVKPGAPVTGQATGQTGGGQAQTGTRTGQGAGTGTAGGTVQAAGGQGTGSTAQGGQAATGQAGQSTAASGTGTGQAPTAPSERTAPIALPAQGAPAAATEALGAPGEAPALPAVTEVSKAPTQKKEEPKAPKVLPSGILAPDSDDVRKAYTPEQKLISNKLFVRVLREFAVSIQSSLSAYATNFKTMMVNQVGKKPEFKNRAELEALLTFFEKMVKSLTKPNEELLDQYLLRVYEIMGHEDGLVKDFSDALQACSFGKIPHLGRETKTIIVSIVVVQRPAVATVSESRQVLSDEELLPLIREFVKMVLEDTGFKAYASSKEEFEKKKAEEKKGKVQTAAVLARDYIEWLYEVLNRVRAHPDFAKYAIMLGEKSAKERKPGELPPILNYLLSPVLSAGQFKTQVSKLFFSEKLLATVWPEKVPLLAAVISDHERRLAEHPEELLPFKPEYLNGLIGIDSVAAIMAFFNQLRSTAKLEDNQKALMSDSETIVRKPDFAQADSDAVIKNLTALGASDDVLKAVRKILDAFIAERAVVGKALTILRAAKATYDKESYAKEQKSIDRFLMEKLLEDPMLKERFKPVLGVERAPSDVYRRFTFVAGKADPVKEIVSMQDFVKMIDLTSLALMVFKNAKETTKKPAEMFDALLNSLESLNMGEIKASADKLFKAITDNRDAVLSGSYKGKLAPVIVDLRKYNLEAVYNKLRELAAQAGYFVDPANEKEFEALMRPLMQFLAQKLLEVLKQELVDFNKGTFTLTLPVPATAEADKVRARNLRVYAALEETMGKNPMPEQVEREKEKLLAEIKSRLLNPAYRIPFLTTNKEEEADRLVNAVREYLEDVQRRVAELKKFAPTPGKVAPKVTTSRPASAPASVSVPVVETPVSAPVAVESAGEGEVPAAPEAPEAPPAPDLPDQVDAYAAQQQSEGVKLVKINKMRLKKKQNVASA